MSGVNVYISSDNEVTVSALRFARTGAYANAATVAASIVNSAGGTVSGSEVTLDYITGSDGGYRGTIPSTITLVEGEQYKLQVTAVQAGADITIRLPFTGKYYEGCA